MMANRQSGNRARVDSTAEENTDWYIGHQAAGNRRIEQPLQLMRRFCFLGRREPFCRGRHWGLPVAAHSEAALVEDGDVPSGQLPRRLQDAIWARNIFRREILNQGILIQVSRHCAMRALSSEPNNSRSAAARESVRPGCLIQVARRASAKYSGFFPRRSRAST